MRITSHSRGDTIIEVLFAITVFSFLAISGMALMNRGTALAQTALEIGLVRQQMDAQADALRYLSHAYSIDFGRNGEATQLWSDIVERHAVTFADKFNEITDGTNCNVPQPGDPKRFTLDVLKMKLADQSGERQPATYAQVRYDDAGGVPARAEGIWIQAVASPEVSIEVKGNSKTRSGFYDFHIRACWNSPGQSTPITLGTIVRLYEPRE